MAEKKTISLTISRVDGPVFDDVVQHVIVPGVDGEMTILPDHTALISPLRSGEIVVTRVDGSIERIAVVSGTIEVSDNVVSILL